MLSLNKDVENNIEPIAEDSTSTEIQTEDETVPTNDENDVDPIDSNSNTAIKSVEIILDIESLDANVSLNEDVEHGIELCDEHSSSSENQIGRINVDTGFNSFGANSSENKTEDTECDSNPDLILNHNDCCAITMSIEADLHADLPEEEDSDFIFSDDPAKWDKKHYNKIIDHILLNNFTQNEEEIDISLTKRAFGNKNHVIPKRMFYTECANKELKKREWLIYSKSMNSVICLTCRLFSNSKESSRFSSSQGFVDWKHPELVSSHEKSKDHQKNICKYILRSKISGKIDTELNRQFISEKQYWIDILKRILSVIKFLSSRGLPFRGTIEKFGDSSNGNYLGVLELIAQYDEVLRNHIKLKGNSGSGSVSYLSKTTCEEFIKLLAETVLKNILNEIKKAKYFSIVVDSTPDISHTDQLTVVIRYVSPDGSPIERFLQFVPNIGHKGIDMFTTILELFEMYDINIMDCRGQSYDNASNMSGKYIGLQARIKEINPRACFIPCAAHSLNLVGLNASSSCLHAVSYFFFVQEVYNFFSASPHRWELLKTAFKDKQLKVPKSLSATRWSARAQAVEALHKGYTEFKTALSNISESHEENNQTKVEAAGNIFS